MKYKAVASATAFFAMGRPMVSIRVIVEHVKRAVHSQS